MPERWPNGLDRLADGLQLSSHRLEVSDQSERSVRRTGLGKCIGRLIGRFDQIVKGGALRVVQTDIAIDAPPRPIQQRALPLLAHPGRLRLIRRSLRPAATAVRTVRSPRVFVRIAGARARCYQARLLLVSQRSVKAFDRRLDVAPARPRRIDGIL